MPMFATSDGASIHYQVAGAGFPVLLLAPGGMRSAIPLWANAPWNPVTSLSNRFQVVAMDQRNAGESRAPVAGDHGWHTYAADQLALMSHLGQQQFHVAGMCIGGPYALGLIDQAPERVASAVLFQPIGLDNNQPLFHDLFDGWADNLKASSHSQVPDADWASFRANMFDTGKLLFNLDQGWLANCQTPLLLLHGNDPYHPAATSDAIADSAPRVQSIRRWKQPDAVADAQAAVATFLLEHTP